MTIKELEFTKKLVERIKPRDEYVEKALAYINKNLAEYASRKGQLKDQYESDLGYWGR